MRTVQSALPLVPGTVEDCCTRIRDRSELQSRDEAREYLTFAQALGLTAEGDQGFYWTRDEPSVEKLGERFRENVFGAREVLNTLDDDDSKAIKEQFDAVRDVVPRWERDRHTDWVAEWHDRTRRLVDWAIEFGLVTRTEDGDISRTT